jgi:hypothetical protein
VVASGAILYLSKSGPALFANLVFPASFGVNGVPVVTVDPTVDPIVDPIVALATVEVELGL